MVNVTESNGEISCSVDDTNKLRALLGLKPLRVSSEPAAGAVNAEAVAVANLAAKRAIEDKDRELAEIQANSTHKELMPCDAKNYTYTPSLPHLPYI